MNLRKFLRIGRSAEREGRQLTFDFGGREHEFVLNAAQYARLYKQNGRLLKKVEIILPNPGSGDLRAKFLVQLKAEANVRG